MKLYKIKDFCLTGSGSTPLRTNKIYYTGMIPWVKSGELKDCLISKTEEYITEEAVKDTRLKKVPRGALLVAMYGATVGRTALLDIEATTNQAVCHLIPDKEKVLTEYLWHALKYKLPEFLSLRVGGAQPNINQEIIQNTLIPLPPLPEQKRIAAVLDKADVLRRKRQESIRLLDELLRSVFLEMFGDPVRNEKGWEVGTIGDIALKTQYGTSKKASENSALDFPMIRMNNISYEGAWDFSQMKYIDLDKSKQEKYLVQQGEILFNRTNSKELVGKTAVYRKQAPMAFAGYLVKLIPNNKANPEFISAYLNSKHGKKILYSMAKSIVGMANINAEELKSIGIYIPPITLQNQFAQIVEKVEHQKQLLEKSLAEMENNFNSLMQRAFRGEL